MHMKIFRIFILFLIMFTVFAQTTHANSPAPQEYLQIKIINKPDELVYCDLLLEFKENDRNYTSLYEPNAEKYAFSENSDLVQYNVDGFESYTFHYKNARSLIKLQEASNIYESSKFSPGEHAIFGADSRDSITKHNLDFRNKYKIIKLIFLGENGNVLGVSEKINLFTSQIAAFDYRIEYDYSKMEIINDGKRVDPNSIYLGLFFPSISLIPLSVFIEVLVSRLFKFDRKSRSYVWHINFTTQLIMRFLQLCVPIPYIPLTIILEILVFITELIYYKKKFPEKGIKKLVIFTAAANITSLIIGIFILDYPLNLNLLIN